MERDLRLPILINRRGVLDRPPATADECAFPQYLILEFREARMREVLFPIR
jgi:hypothetical protein